MSLFDNRATRAAIKLVSKKTPKEQNSILSSLEAELNKLPRKQREKARKLMEKFEKGQVLIANKDIDNKKIILDSE